MAPIMRKISVGDAEKQLRHLIDEVDRGEEVVITRGDGASFKLVPLPKQTPHPTFGSAAGEVWVSEDFDAPLDDFDDYMPS
jgi:antitoxin (DNA-binding transcriptional repressor) of toxin-antitoxin stability system